MKATWIHVCSLHLNKIFPFFIGPSFCLACQMFLYTAFAIWTVYKINQASKQEQSLRHDISLNVEKAAYRCMVSF